MGEVADLGGNAVGRHAVAPPDLARIPWLISALAVVAVAGLVAAAVGISLGVSARTGSGALTSTVIPTRTDTQGSATNAAGTDLARSAAGAAGAVPLAQASFGLGGAASAPSFGMPIVYGGACPTAPTVQFQGRGLATTGVAVIVPTDQAIVNLSVSVQERGSDAATVIANAQAKVQAVITALQQVGASSSSIQQTSFSSYGDFQGKQSTAYASVQAQVMGNDQLARATRAVLAVGGVYAYSTNSGLAAQPSEAEVQTAVSMAAVQASDTARATARAAAVTLGSVESIATQPPAFCYGQSGPMRVVQVTINYALK